MSTSPRSMRVVFHFPRGDVVYNQDMNIRVKCNKTVLSAYNLCTIDIMNMDPAARSAMLSSFNLFWQQRQRTPMVPVSVYIGRLGADDRLIYKGYVITCEISMPPDINMTITCGTAVTDRTKYVDKAVLRGAGTFESLCQKVAKILDLDFDSRGLSPKYAKMPIRNFNTSSTYEALIVHLSTMYQPYVAVYVDDNRLVAQDVANIVDPNRIIEVNVSSGMIGIPSWTQWGVQATVMADLPIILGNGVVYRSIINPTIPDAPMVVNKIEYELTSRDNAWYSKIHASPAAGDYTGPGTNYNINMGGKRQ